jgi:tyrosine-protein phosphatase SIW14
MKKFIFLFILLIISANRSFCAEDKTTERVVSLPRAIFNFHVVDSGVMRGSRPSGEALALLKNHAGLKTILSLDNNEQLNQGEKEMAESLGIRFINIPMHSSEEQEPAKIESCLDIINDKSNQPIFIHCQAGKDRTGLIMAAYRIKYEHWTLDEALREMLLYGYDRGCCRNLEKSLENWAKEKER